MKTIEKSSKTNMVLFVCNLSFLLLEKNEIDKERKVAHKNLLVSCNHDIKKTHNYFSLLIRFVSTEKSYTHKKIFS